MGREERRAEQKSRRRKLLWLEKHRKRNERIDKVVTAIEENFDENEVEKAKAFVTDALAWSGSFSKLKEEFHDDDLERVGEDYGLERFDAIFIFDLLNEMLPAEGSAEPEE
jgi:hypothetical protein